MCTSLFLSVSIVCIYTKAIFKNTISSLCAKYKNLRPKRCFCVFGLSIRLLFWGQGITAIPTVYIWRLGHKPTECWLSCSGSHWMTIWAILQSPHLTSPLPGPLCTWPSVYLYSFLLMHTHAISLCPVCWPLPLPACKSFLGGWIICCSLFCCSVKPECHYLNPCWKAKTCNWNMLGKNKTNIYAIL